MPELSCNKATPPLDDVQVEYRMDAARPDIALRLRGRVIGALEILVTHAVDERKAAYFQEQGIPWLEIPAAPELYSEPTAWTAAAPLPLPPSKLPYPAWTCEECALQAERNRQEHERQEKQAQAEREREQRRPQVLRAEHRTPGAGGSRFQACRSTEVTG